MLKTNEDVLWAIREVMRTIQTCKVEPDNNTPLDPPELISIQFGDYWIQEMLPNDPRVDDNRYFVVSEWRGDDEYGEYQDTNAFTSLRAAVHSVLLNFFGDMITIRLSDLASQRDYERDKEAGLI